MTENEFIQAFKTYNQNVFNFVYLRIGSKEIAQDLTQEIYIKLWDYKHKFDPEKSNIKTWLYKIAKNHLVDFFRKNKNNFKNEVELEAIGEEQNQDRDLDIQFIIIKLSELDSDEQDLIIMKYIEDLSNEEIAQIIDKNINATKVAIYRAMEKLKRIINSKNV